MNKYLTPVLAGVSLVLAVAFAYNLGSQHSVSQEVDRFMRSQSTEDVRYEVSAMGNRMNSSEDMHAQGGQSFDTNTDLSATDYDLAQLETILQVTLADEYKARAEYVALVDVYGEVSPLVELIQAETKHVDALTRLFEMYGLDVPADNGAEFAVVPASLEEAYQIGIEAEVYNISLYENYLTTDLPTNVETVFTHLMSASENHLATFEAYAAGEPVVHMDQQESSGQMSSSTRGGRWN